MTNKNYCPRIHHGLVLDNISRTELTYSACCWGTESISTEKVIDFTHPRLQKLRITNQQELPIEHCAACITSEAAGSDSMRTGYLQMHGEETYDTSIQYLDINIDYTCNLACVTCGPALSTTWRNELGIKGRDVRPIIDQFFESTLNGLDLSQLREVRMWGGEPLLTTTHKRILEYVIEHADSSKVRLMYNTNGTQCIDADTKKLIEQFKFARISFSIDGIGNKFEYLRYPAKWKTVEENLFWWKENLPHNSMLSVTVTASILNVLDLNQVFAWHRDNFSKSCFGDDIEIYVHQAFGMYSMDAMPPEMIVQLRSIQDYCQPWIQNLTLLGQKSHTLPTIRAELEKNDQRRGLHFPTVMPEVAKFIQYQRSPQFLAYNL